METLYYSINCLCSTIILQYCASKDTTGYNIYRVCYRVKRVSKTGLSRVCNCKILFNPDATHGHRQLYVNEKLHSSSSSS